MQSNCHDLPESGTLVALRAFAAAYERAIGRRLKVYDLARDVCYLRDVLEIAIGSDQQELYSAADQLVLALRAAPLPVNRYADNGSSCGSQLSGSVHRPHAVETASSTESHSVGFLRAPVLAW